ncbi:hypothetical protein [Candidatus Agathobaculum pullicola]|uniref:hypothetical protein n=1 Tax=Candidatus Agathobaculum pullicola TaxID=2838426 RepID=UPI003F8E50DC
MSGWEKPAWRIGVNDKRTLRTCLAGDIQSTVKCNNHGCTRQAKNPQHLAENLLGRQFFADRPNEKWLAVPLSLALSSEQSLYADLLNAKISREQGVQGTSAAEVLPEMDRMIDGMEFGS